MPKAMLIVMDGLGDRPIKELGNLTPLEAARTPNLDALAARGITGIMNAIGVGQRPGSDTSHLAILGYDIDKYYTGRGTIEVAGLGMDLKEGDVALRGNLGTVDDNLVVTDRRAGRITDTGPFVRDLDGLTYEGVTLKVRPGTGHRAGIILRGPGLSSRISDNDPHEVGVKVHEVHPLDGSPEAAFTAKVLNHLLTEAHRLLRDHPLNKERLAQGKPAANYLLGRGAGYYKEIEKFQQRYGLRACTIAGGGLYKGIGAFTGMDLIEVPGATGLPNTDVAAKFRAALEALAGPYDFAFVHVKAADTFGEDGDFQGKKAFIEKVDAAAAVLLDAPHLLVATADHTTPCVLKRHSGDPVPLMMIGDGLVRPDLVTQFGERPCARGDLGRLTGLQVMPEIINLLGLAKLIGD
ncbi:MAG: 2,3-bisphosphoglycerate-independent phosphoglycerate mutase [Deltaproteobacteria bacterium]|nr:2,3-bisphosphoglycerate-independent phosphoglycerate mutase [Deltaproteobacteria bacterium]